jgi:ABC-type uncharacterized transport system ATPase subunit
MTASASASSPGEIHALLGENGAGKSTLVKIIYGVLHPDGGEIRWKGERVSIANPAAARTLGIGMVFQHFSVFEALTVAENIALGLNDAAAQGTARRASPKVSEDYGLQLDPDTAVHDLSVGERQRVEIVRCLLQKPKLLIMDEPTSVLTPQEIERLFTPCAGSPGRLRHPLYQPQAGRDPQLVRTRHHHAPGQGGRANAIRARRRRSIWPS